MKTGKMDMVCTKCAFTFPADQPPPSPSGKTADYIGRGLAVLTLLAIGAGLAFVPYEQVSRCLIVFLAVIIGIMVGCVILPHENKKGK